MRKFLSVVALLGSCLLLAVQGAEPPANPPRKNPHDKLPVFHWDKKSIEALGTIVSTRYDAPGNRVVWIVETKKFEQPGRVAPIFIDDEGSPLTTGQDLEFTLLPPEKKEKKDKDKNPREEAKERVQIVLHLASKEVMKETFRVVLHKFY
jgi:hypothetical protein